MSVYLPLREDKISASATAADIRAADRDDTEMLPSGDAAQHYYKEVCKELQIRTNSSFLTQLQSESVVIIFENNYLGKNGIAAIVTTLQRYAIQVLILNECGLEVEEVKHICNAFRTHPTLERLDLRGNRISVGGSRCILSLVCRNSHITEVALDHEVSHREAIAQQCRQNMHANMTAQSCIACNGRLAVGGGSEDPSYPCVSAPSVVFCVLRKHFTDFMKERIAPVELYTFFTLIVQVCDSANAIFSICSESCARKITLDLLSCASYARAAVFGARIRNLPGPNVECPFPQGVHCKWQTPTRTVIQKFRKEFVAKGVSAKIEDRTDPGDSFEETLDQELDITKAQSNLTDKVCPLCGITFTHTDVMHVASALLKFLLEDVDFYLATYFSILGASVFLRICRTMAQYANLAICCSLKCLGHLSRFALYGFRGVLQSFPMKHDPFLSSMVSLAAMKRFKLPQCSFSVLDLSTLTIYDAGEEDISCALTVSSAMEDIERVPIDPYFIYAAGRHLSQQPRESIGMTLESACAAVCTFGCLEASVAAFQQRRGPTHASRPITDWAAWTGSRKDIAGLLHSAFARRRSGVYGIDGPYNNLFDNIRAILWAFRRHRRCVVVAIEASLDWFGSSEGVIRGPGPVSRGTFYTTVKVVGQSVLQNEPHLVLQGHFGTHAGYKGFFYITRNLFNRCTVGNAYIFLDCSHFLSYADSSAHSLSLARYPRNVLSPCARELFDQFARDVTPFCKVFRSLSKFSTAEDPFSVTDDLLHVAANVVLQRLPPILFFLRESDRRSGVVVPDSKQTILELVATFLSRKCIHPVSPSEWIFMLSEIFGAEVCRWFSFTWRTLANSALPCTVHDTAGEPPNSALQSTPLPDASKHYSPERWISLSSRVPDPEARDDVEMRSCPTKEQISSPSKLVDERREEERGDASNEGAGNEACTVSPVSFCLPSFTGDQLRVDTCQMDFNYFGKRWSAVHLCDTQGIVSPFIICFLTDTVCLYDLSTSKVAQPTSKLKPYSSLLGDFPFTTGLDCAFHHPLRPREVILFCSRQFAIWDAASRKCLRGPCTYHNHEPFVHLPESFTRVEAGGVSAALPFPGTPFVALFNRSQQYVVYDIEKRKVQSLGTVSLSQKKACFADADEPWDRLKLEIQDVSEPKLNFSSRPSLEDDAQRSVSVSPMGDEIMEYFASSGIPMALLSANARPTRWSGVPSEVGSGEVSASSFLLPMPNGKVLLMKMDSGMAKVDANNNHAPLVSLQDSKLCQLPLAFRQLAGEALPSICSAVAQHQVQTNSYLTSLRLYKPPTNLVGLANLESNGLSHNYSAFSLRESRSVPQETGLVRVTHHWVPTTHIHEPGFPNWLLSPSPSLAPAQMRGDIVAPKEEVCCYYYTEQGIQAASDRSDQLTLSLSTVEPCVQFDFGSTQAESFGAVIIVTNVLFDGVLRASQLPFIEGSEVKLFIELSNDGICFQPVTSNFTARSHLLFASWKEVPAARYWRIRLGTIADCAMPAQLADFGFVRILWYHAEWQPPLEKFRPLQTFMPSVEEMPEVNIAAPCVLCRPENILNCGRATNVFMAPTYHGWWERHVILPLLRNGDRTAASAALFFCGDSFCEMNLDSCEVVANRSVALRRHPAFRTLPYPFYTGLDGAFYTDLGKHAARVVTLLRDGLQLQWNLDEGHAEGEVTRWDAVGEFKGIPIDMEKDLVHIANTWRHPQEVRVIYKVHSPRQLLGTLCWDMDRCVVTEGPMLLRDYPPLNCPELGDRLLSCVFSTPQNSTSFIIFAEELVANPTIPPCGSASSLWKVSPITLSRAFYRLRYSLPAWGLQRRDAIVTVDLQSHARLILGVEMECQGTDCNRKWEVEYSDDAIHWCTVSSHCQSRPFARTTWSSSRVEGVSHRFWRLSTSCLPPTPEQAAFTAPIENADQRLTFYSGIRFLVLPHAICSALPSRLNTSGQLVGKAEGVFLPSSSDDHITFQGSLASVGVGSATRPRSIVIDYASHAPAFFTGLSILCTLDREGNHKGLLTSPTQNRVTGLLVQWSHDGITWESCGFFSSPFAGLNAFWDPTNTISAARFWKLEFQASSTLVVKQITFFVAQCPLLKLHSSPHSPPTSCTSLLWSSPSAQQPCANSAAVVAVAEAEGARFSAPLGGSLVLDMTSLSVVQGAICGVELQCVRSAAGTLGFCVQCAQSEAKWLSVSYFEMHPGQTTCAATWPPLGHYRFWRLHIVLSSCTFTRLQRVQWLTSNFVLHKEIPSQRREPPEDPKELNEPLLVAEFACPEVIVGIKIHDLPPRSRYAVERLELDGITWREMTQVESRDSLISSNVVKYWEPGLPSTQWRLRPIKSSHNSNSTSLSVLDGSPPHTISVPFCRARERPEPYLLARWLGLASEEPFQVDISSIEGAAVSCQNFEQLRPVSDLCAIAAPARAVLALPGKPILRSVRNVETNLSSSMNEPSVCWHFSSSLRLDRVCVYAFLKSSDTGVPSALQTTIVSEACSSHQRAMRQSRKDLGFLTKSLGKRPGSMTKEEARPSLGSFDEDIQPSFPSVVVETSYNGTDYVPLAESFFSDGLTMLSWSHPGEPFPYWRLRLRRVPSAAVVDVSRVDWFALRGVASALVRPTQALSLTMSNTAYATWQSDSFNHEREFYAQCVSGYAQARCKVSGMLETEELDRYGTTAERVWLMKKQYERFILKKRKEAAGGNTISLESFPLSAKGLLSDNLNLASDLNYLLFCSSECYGSNFGHLITLIRQRMNLGNTFELRKKNFWFYPCVLITGKLVEPFYGLEGLFLSYSVYWSLSVAVQRDLDQLQNPYVNALSPHLASPVIALYVSSPQCCKAANFSGLPLLAHAGFGVPLAGGSDRDHRFMVICFALNEIAFSDKYPLHACSNLGNKTLSSRFPYRIFYGVNFIQSMSLASFPSPILDLLQNIYPQSFLDDQKVLVVFNAPSTQSHTAELRFTLPGASSSLLQAYGVCVDSIEFEVRMRLIGDVSESPSNGSSFRPSCPSSSKAKSAPRRLPGRSGTLNGRRSRSRLGREVEYQANFITHGARYELNKGTPPVPPDALVYRNVKDERLYILPVSFVGSLCSAPASFTLKGEVPSACIPFDPIPAAYLTFISIVGTTATSPRELLNTVDYVTISGKLFLPSGKSYTCFYDVAPGVRWNEWSEISLELVQASLEELFLLTEYFTHQGVGERASVLADAGGDPQKSFLTDLDIAISGKVVIDVVKHQLRGVGSARWGGAFSHDLHLIVNEDGFMLSGTLPFLRLGSILIESCVSPDTAVFFDLRRAKGVKGAVLHVFGACSFGTAMRPILTRLEVSSERGILVVATTGVFDLCIDAQLGVDAGLGCLSRGFVAQVKLHREFICSEIETRLRAKPIIVALCAHDIPFCFNVHGLVEEPLVLCGALSASVSPEQWLSFSLHGVLFGASFEIFCSWPLQDMWCLSLRANFEGLVRQIMLQCEENLWSCYANVVGCVELDDRAETNPNPSRAPSHLATLPILERHLVSDEGCFMSQWLKKECEMFEEDLR